MGWVHPFNKQEKRNRRPVREQANAPRERGVKKLIPTDGIGRLYRQGGLLTSQRGMIIGFARMGGIISGVND